MMLTEHKRRRSWNWRWISKSNFNSVSSLIVKHRVVAHTIFTQNCPILFEKTCSSGLGASILDSGFIKCLCCSFSAPGFSVFEFEMIFWGVVFSACLIDGTFLTSRYLSCCCWYNVRACLKFKEFIYEFFCVYFFSFLPCGFNFMLLMFFVV